MTDTQTELERLRQEVTQLRKALAERNTPSVPGFVVDDAPNLPALVNNFELVIDLTRYAEGLLEEKHIRKKYRFTEDTWTALGHDEKFIEAVELERIRRVRDGSFKREKSQQHVTRAPDVLAGIMDDPKQSAKHRIDSAKVLDSFSGNGPKDALEQDRIIIRIDMGADTRVKGEPSDPANILVVDAVVPPNKPSDDTKVIDSWDTPKQLELNQEEPVPPKRGGSKNKPKQPELDATPPLPGFAT
jgi:hypothetical protein